MAWRGKDRHDKAWRGRRGGARLGVARIGAAWQARRGANWRGVAFIIILKERDYGSDKEGGNGDGDSD